MPAAPRRSRLFELANRAYFAAPISDRGDDFLDRYNASLAEQEAVPSSVPFACSSPRVASSVLGRFNLYDLENGTAALGYRIV